MASTYRRRWPANYPWRNSPINAMSSSTRISSAIQTSCTAVARKATSREQSTSAPPAIAVCKIGSSSGSLTIAGISEGNATRTDAASSRPTNVAICSSDKGHRSRTGGYRRTFSASLKIAAEVTRTCGALTTRTSSSLAKPAGFGPGFSRTRTFVSSTTRTATSCGADARRRVRLPARLPSQP